MQIKVNEAQMQEYADYMDSIPAKLEAAGSAVQSVVSWMQNEEMLSEVSRGNYLTGNSAYCQELYAKRTGTNG